MDTAPPGGLFISGPFKGWGAYSRGSLIERGIIYSSKKPAMEITSLNCNKLKIITQDVSYNNNSYNIYVLEISNRKGMLRGIEYSSCITLNSCVRIAIVL